MCDSEELEEYNPLEIAHAAYAEDYNFDVLEGMELMTYTRRPDGSETRGVDTVDMVSMCRTASWVTHTGADPGFFPRGGPVGHSATKTPQASQGKVRRGVRGASPKKILNMKCSRSDSEQTSGTLEIFSRAIFLGTLLQFCENSEERVQSQIRNFMV